jgi:hypothetical protein
MKLESITACILVAATAFTTGCSKSSDLLTQCPIPTAQRESASQVHNLAALYTFSFDAEKVKLDIAPLRDAQLHLNAVKFLEPAPLIFLTLESGLKYSGSILDVDIGLRHPMIAGAQYTGFDVCGIVFTHGSVSGFHDPDVVLAGPDDFRLLNPDGYTRWWNPKEFPHGDTTSSYRDGLLGTPAAYADFNTTVNGYKYFADGLGKDDPISALDQSKRGMFQVFSKNIRHYTLRIPGNLIFNYAVDACWKKPTGGPPITPPGSFPPEANRPEPYGFVIHEMKNTLYFLDASHTGGGQFQLYIDVYDHYDSNLDIIYGESLDGLPSTVAITPSGGGNGYSTYVLSFNGNNLKHNGAINLLITAQSQFSGYGGILPGKPLSTYYIYAAMVSGFIPTDSGWARTWGGPSEDESLDTAADNYGGIYTVGLYGGMVDFNPGSGFDWHTSNGAEDAYIVKLNNNGSFAWARTWGGNQSEDICWAVAVDNVSHSVYLAGKFRGTADLNPGPGTDNHTSHGIQDAFLISLDMDGNFKWARNWGRADEDFGVAVDSFGCIYVTGNFSGDDVDFDPGPGTDIHSAIGSHDTFLSKFSPDGTFVWVRTWGFAGSVYNKGVACSFIDNAVYITADAGLEDAYDNPYCDLDPGPGVANFLVNQGSDFFLVKLTSSGDYSWGYIWGADTEFESPQEVAVDSSGSVYLGGSFEGDSVSDFDPGPGVDIHHTAGYTDAFLMKFSAGGTYKWAKTWGGEYSDTCSDIAVSQGGAVFAIGTFSLEVDFDPGPGTDIHSCPGGSSDAYISEFDLNGNHQWTDTWGYANNDDLVSGVAGDGYGNSYVTGTFYGPTDFDPGPGQDWHTSGGIGDVFLVKFLSDGGW